MNKPELVFYVAEEGVPVVHIDTPEFGENAQGPICRIYLNDALIFANPAPAWARYIGQNATWEDQP